MPQVRRIDVLSVPGALASVAVETAGATVQGVLGFGINLVAAPLLVLIDPRFAPLPVVLASMVGSALVSVRERGAVERPMVAWALAGRVPGTALGALVVIAVAGARLRPIVGVIVLAGVGLALAGRSMRRTRRTLIGVGVASGVMSTIAGLGGAPFGLACHDLPGPVLRSTLAVFVLGGAVFSVAALAGAGQVSTESLRLTALLVPGVFGGFGLSSALVPFADRLGAVRPLVLAVAAVGALAAVVKGPW